MSIGLIIMSTASTTNTMKRLNSYISDIVELQVVFDEEAVDSSKMNLETLFTKVDKTGKIPKTSQPTPFAIEDAIKKGFEKFNNLIIITPHSAISGTYQNCINVATEDANSERIKIFEVNGGIAITEAMLIDYSLSLIEEKLAFSEMIEKIEEFNKRLTIYTFPGDFKYLKVSGRVSGAAALLLNALNIRVVIKMEGGKPIIDHKGRGEKSVLKYIANEISVDKVERVYYTPIMDDRQMRERVLKLLVDSGFDVEMTAEANSVPAAHLGPNNFGLGVLYK